MINSYYFPNLGFIMDDVPQEILNNIKSEISLIDYKTPRFNNRLAGNLKRSFKLTESISCLEPYTLNLLEQYDREFDYIRSINIIDANLPFKLNDLWVNIQSKHEFNPNHAHLGVLSFVIWIKIPFLIEDELVESPGIYSNKNVAGNFEFSGTNILGQIISYNIPVDKTYEGKIIMFPSKMSHCVYPFFSSDSERITVSGNIVLRSKKI